MNDLSKMTNVELLDEYAVTHLACATMVEGSRMKDGACSRRYYARAELLSRLQRGERLAEAVEAIATETLRVTDTAVMVPKRLHDALMEAFLSAPTAIRQEDSNGHS